jgi:hypothetical protein
MGLRPIGTCDITCGAHLHTQLAQLCMWFLFFLLLTRTLTVVLHLQTYKMKQSIVTQYHCQNYILLLLDWDPLPDHI